MKKLTALAVLLTVIGTASFASTSPLGESSSFKVIAKADTKYEIVYVSSKESDVRVFIYDEMGKNISSSTVKDISNFRRTYDFGKLQPGKYAVVVRNEDGSAREVINHLIKKKRLQTFVTKIPDTKSLKLHVGDYNSEKPVHIKIYNSRNRIIHKDVISNTNAFSKVYNMKKAKSGEFKVEIENDGEYKYFTHKID